MKPRSLGNNAVFLMPLVIVLLTACVQRGFLTSSRTQDVMVQEGIPSDTVQPASDEDVSRLRGKVEDENVTEATDNSGAPTQPEALPAQSPPAVITALQETLLKSSVTNANEKWAENCVIPKDTKLTIERDFIRNTGHWGVDVLKSEPDVTATCPMLKESSFAFLFPPHFQVPSDFQERDGDVAIEDDTSGTGKQRDYVDEHYDIATGSKLAKVLLNYRNCSQKSPLPPRMGRMLGACWACVSRALVFGRVRGGRGIFSSWFDLGPMNRKPYSAYFVAEEFNKRQRFYEEKLKLLRIDKVTKETRASFRARTLVDAPVGSLVVWPPDPRGRCFNMKHGHIEIVVERGKRACSDGCRSLTDPRKWGCQPMGIYMPFR